jgi:putative membrane protein
MTLLAALAISTSAAVAQTPAVKSPSATNPAAPVPGANSFTEGQAKSKIEAAGYTEVSGLKKDDNGVWTGTASQGGKKVTVKVDFQGNVTQ